MVIQSESSGVMTSSNKRKPVSVTNRKSVALGNANSRSTSDYLRESIKDTSIIIPGLKKPLNEEILLKASKLKKAYTFSIPIEYWQSYAKRWTTEAKLSISKSRTKLHLDFHGIQNEVTSPSGVHENLVWSQQRVTFYFYNLVVEHSDPLQRNFLAVLSGGGQILRHRIAFYSEADGNFVINLLKKFGAQIVVRGLVASPFQIQSNIPSPWNEWGRRRKISCENERDFLNDRVTQQRKSIALGESFSHKDHNQDLEKEKEAAMIFRRQSTGSYMDYSNGKQSPYNQDSLLEGQNSSYTNEKYNWNDGVGPNKRLYNKNPNFQRKNSMSSQLRKSMSRSHSSDMSTNIRINQEANRFSSIDRENMSVPIKRNNDTKKYSDQSLNSHNSDEYYEDDEIQEGSEKESINNSSEEEDDFFLSNSMSPPDRNDMVDGNILNHKKVPSHRFFSRLVEATSSFSNSTPSLPSMVRRASYLNSSKNHVLQQNRQNDVKLHGAKFYLNEEELIVNDNKATEDTNVHSTKLNNNEELNTCDCWSEDDESLDGNKYEPSKMFGLINCEHKGYVGFEFDDYPDHVLIQDMEKRTSYTPNSFDKNALTKSSEENTDEVIEKRVEQSKLDNHAFNESCKDTSGKNVQLKGTQIPDNAECTSLFEVTSNDSINNNNELNNSSRNSSITSYNWIRRSFEDLDIEVVQTEMMQKRKRKDSSIHHQLNMERKQPSLSFSSSLNSEDFHYKESKNSKDVPYGDKDASNCFECRRMLGQVIDDANGISEGVETSSHCDSPITQISCCEKCCSSCTLNNRSDENEDTLMEDIESKVPASLSEGTEINTSHRIPKISSDLEPTKDSFSIMSESQKNSKSKDITIPLLKNTSLDRFYETSTSTNL